MSRARSLSALVLGLATLTFGASACARDPHELAQREFASKVKSTFGLALPCSLAWCEAYPGEWSVGGALAGVRGDSLQWAWGPGATQLPLPPESITQDPGAMTAWADSVTKSIRRHAFIGVKHFSDPGAKPLAIGSPEESLFVHVLWAAVMRDSVSMKTHGPRGKGLMAAYVARTLEEQRARVGTEAALGR